MENFKGKLSEYIEKNKKNSKLSKTDVDEVSSILKAGLIDNSASIDGVIEIILDLHYAVTSGFIKNVFNDLNSVIKTEFITKFLRTDKIVANANNFGISRCLIIVNELLKTTSNVEFIHTILQISSKRIYDKDGGKKAGELLSKICFEETKTKLFLLDYSKWPENALINLSVWFDNAIVYTNDVEIIDNYNAFIDKYNLPKSKKTDVNTITITLNPEMDKTYPKKEQKEKIVVLVSELQSEVHKIINEKVKLSREIEEVKSQLQQLNKDKENLTVKLSEAGIINNQIQEQIKSGESKIIGFQKKITEMNERLAYAYKADKRAENQEMISLKNDLVKQLRLDYNTFQKLATKEPAEYQLYYEGLVGIIENIFDALRRKGIVINNENEG